MQSRLLDLYLKYRAALPLAAFLLYLNTTMSVSGSIKPLQFLCGLSFMALYEVIYAYDARFRNKEDAVNLPEGRRTVHSVRHLLAAAAVPVCLLVYAGFLPLLIYAAAGMFLYSTPKILPRRLKTIPGLKLLVNMLNFWLVGIFAPVLFKYPLSFGLFFSALRSSVQALIAIFCLNVLADIRDVEGDRAAGVFTVPTAIGPRASVWLLVMILAAAGIHAFMRGDTWGIVFAVTLSIFSFSMVKPRSRLYYELGMGFTNVYLAAVLIYRLK